MTGSAAVGLRRDGAVARIEVGSGRRANALGVRDWRALAELLDGLSQDPSLGAVVLSGRGTAAFSAGSDMREWLGADPERIDDAFAVMEETLRAVEHMPAPVIAQIRGAAVGAGCQLACACDLRVIADEAHMGMPVARWGILVPPAFAARLALLTGPARTRDLLYTGRLVDGAEAVRIGLATLTVPAARLPAATDRLLASITAHPPAAIRAAKRSLDQLLEPVHDHVRKLPAGPSADYTTMRTGLTHFLSRLA
ncbi:putative enoyl-CoA hydratase/isomerase YngF [Streptomyces fumigatiscleroticus]|nr:putative enoyl-CoA hydratase/isomerase YngF [Streptomyces fumigatiscleroticus]